MDLPSVAVEPYNLDDEQIRFVIGGYAAFAEDKDIFEEFCKVFEKEKDEFEWEDGKNWGFRLMESIKRLNPARHDFPTEYNLMFNGLRRNYLNSLDESYLGHSRNRMKVIDSTYKNLVKYADEYPEHYVECQKLINKVVSEARTEAHSFYDAKDRSPIISEEEAKRLLAKLTPEQFEEFCLRHDDGEDPSVILADLQKLAITTARDPDPDDADEPEPVQEVLQGAEDLQPDEQGDKSEVEQGAEHVDISSDGVS